MDLNIAPHTLCYELDKICAPYYFTFSGSITGNRVDAIHVYRYASDHEAVEKFKVSTDDPLDFVVTKIILKFGGGGTISA